MQTRTLELHGYYLEDLYIEQTAVFGKTITETDVLLFSGVSGDTNPLHLNKDFASQTQFGECIVHGMLTASLISALIGTRLPGPGCVYMSQSIKWTHPVKVGDTVMARVTVIDINHDKAHVRLQTTCCVDDEIVLEGEALIKTPRRAPATLLV